MNYLVGTPISDTVAQSIKDRQKIFEANDGLLRQAYIQYQSLVPWVRLSSAVKIKPDSKTAQKFGTSGNQLAKDNVLFTLFNKETDGLPGYEKTQLGYRPAPGIQDMQIHSHNRFGSLRTAVIRYQCWSKEQLDVLELLYMRPGFNVFLEWGWSGYLQNNDGNYTVDTLVNPIDFTSYSTRESATAAMIAKRKKYNYHYDGIAGVVKNFTWSLRNDGGYDCSTHVVTAGDVAESLKINFYVSNRDIKTAIQDATNKVDEAANKVTQKVVKVQGVDKPVVLTDIVAKAKITPRYPSKSEIRYKSPVPPPDFSSTADPAAGKELEKLYAEFKTRIVDALKVTSQKSIAKDPVKNGLYINLEEGTFGYYGSVPQLNDLNRLIKSAENFVTANPEVEILERPNAINQLVVMRFINYTI